MVGWRPPPVSNVATALARAPSAVRIASWGAEPSTQLLESCFLSLLSGTAAPHPARTNRPSAGPRRCGSLSSHSPSYPRDPEVPKPEETWLVVPVATSPRARHPPRPSLSQGPPVAPVLVQPPPAWAQGFLSGPLPKPSPARCQEAFSNANLIMWLQILSQSIFPPRTNYRFLGKALRSLACGSYPSLQQHFTTLPSHTAVAALLLLPLGLCALPWPFPALPWPDIPRKYFLRNSSRRPSLSPGRTRCSLIYPTQPINRLIGIFILFPSQIIIPSRARAMFCSPVFGLVPKTTLL